MFLIFGVLFTAGGLISWLLKILLKYREFRKLAVKQSGQAATATRESINSVRLGDGSEIEEAIYSFWDGHNRKEVSRRAISGPFPTECEVWILKDRVVFDVDILEKKDIEAKWNWPSIMLFGGLLQIAIGLLARTLA